MSIFIDSNASKKVKGKYIYLDNDFLAKIFSDEVVFKNFIENFYNLGYFIIDPLSEFEFLRDIFVPKQRILVERFIKKDIFLPTTNHQEIFKKIQINALILSKIFAHQRKGIDSPSFVDLFLAGRLMYEKDTSILITGNKKDFPTCVFDILGVMNTEEKNDSLKTFCLIGFNEKKFKICHDKLLKLEEKEKEELEN